MTQHPLHQFLGWLGHLWPADDTRTQARLAKREVCTHGEDDPCSFNREDFNCNDCDVDEGSGQMMPRI